MIAVLPVLALVIGLVLGFAFVGPVKTDVGIYIAVACLAGLDSVCGGIRSGLEGKFHNDVFSTGFVSNILIASFLAWLGDQMNINLFLAVALVLGARIFTNLSLIRRFLLTKWLDAQEKKRLQELAAQPPPIQADTAQ